MLPRRRMTVLGLSSALLTVIGLTAPSASALGLRLPTLRVVGQVSQQDIPPRPGSEPDTLVEPDVAVSPLDPKIAVAASHDGRYPDGGAVGISYAWTHDGGNTWRHAPLPGVTQAAGGVWERASDPVLAFGPDGSVYLSVLVFGSDCPTGITVSRSTDGGATFAPPVLAHYSAMCDYSDDKNTIVVDNGRYSPHRGRIYQFWTPFLYDADGNNTGALQVVRWSDNKGRTWSPTVNLTADGTFSQNSQPMIKPDGAVVDAYLDFGTSGGREGPEAREGDEAARTLASPALASSAAAAAVQGDLFVARTSRDGGATWSDPVSITHDAGEGPDGIRCCLPSATADPITGRLFATWNSADPTVVRLAQSFDGTHWSAAVDVARSPAGFDQVNADVTAYAGEVFVSFGTRNTAVQNGRFVQQRLATSFDGNHFAAPIPLGPVSDLRYAAFAGGLFPGDYIGTASTRGRVYAVWCVSSAPADPAAQYHQVVYGATLTT